MFDIETSSECFAEDEAFDRLSFAEQEIARLEDLQVFKNGVMTLMRERGVEDKELFEAVFGYKPLQVGDIVTTNGRYFELKEDLGTESYRVTHAGVMPDGCPVIWIKDKRPDALCMDGFVLVEKGEA